MKMLIVSLAFALGASPALAADKCDLLAPTTATNLEQGPKAKVDGAFQGALARIVGAKADAAVEYRKVVTDTLKEYPNADKAFVWQRVLYLACVSPESKVDVNDLFKLYLSGPEKKSSILDRPAIVGELYHTYVAVAAQYAFLNSWAKPPGLNTLHMDGKWMIGTAEEPHRTVQIDLDKQRLPFNEYYAAQIANISALGDSAHYVTDFFDAYSGYKSSLDALAIDKNNVNRSLISVLNSGWQVIYSGHEALCALDIAPPRIFPNRNFQEPSSLTC